MSVLDWLVLLLAGAVRLFGHVGALLPPPLRDHPVLHQILGYALVLGVIGLLLWPLVVLGRALHRGGGGGMVGASLRGIGGVLAVLFAALFVFFRMAEGPRRWR